MSLFREQTPEDGVRDAFCYAVMLYLKREHGYMSIMGERFIVAMSIFYALLEMENHESKKLFLSSEHQMQTVAESLSNAAIDRVMFRKTGQGNRYYFEPDFEDYAEDKIRRSLSTSLLRATKKVMRDTMSIFHKVQSLEDAHKELGKYKLHRGH